ncbi:hypothetical protein [uncultured Amaricoccus sp.]|uniref:hypothetical protein n=1 Tax=uncultured Amaricoccus sp. TaxID=339341 RepID=UPI0026301A75|nr:hypothetical protein [uncultured Amaricoccus sp.]
MRTAGASIGVGVAAGVRTLSCPPDRIDAPAASAGLGDLVVGAVVDPPFGRAPSDEALPEDAPPRDARPDEPFPEGVFPDEVPFDDVPLDPVVPEAACTGCVATGGVAGGVGAAGGRVIPPPRSIPSRNMVADPVSF